MGYKIGLNKEALLEQITRIENMCSALEEKRAIVAGSPFVSGRQSRGPNAARTQDQFLLLMRIIDSATKVMQSVVEYLQASYKALEEADSQ